MHAAHRTLFPTGETTDFYFNQHWSDLDLLLKNKNVIFITDENIFKNYPSFFHQKNTLVLPAGETSKSMETVVNITKDLIAFEADKTSFLVGVGGGVISDITGFVAAVYMRGIAVGFVPTSLLGMVDAAIGGKNGVNFQTYKNSIGTIRQPDFIFYDYQFLATLPDEEWSNGFAEIIKYGCILDKNILDDLSQHSIAFFKQQPQALQRIITQCALLKIKIVQEDTLEKDKRKLLNFGHTVGHAIENTYQLSHGKAVAIGMIIAAKLSEKYTALPTDAVLFLKTLIEKYKLPTTVNYATNEVMQALKMDKKRKNNFIDFIVLQTLGKAEIRPTSFDEIEQILTA
jgi:3-dehydroquinate synthase